jgi:molybdate transport system regulatory protein
MRPLPSEEACYAQTLREGVACAVHWDAPQIERSDNPRSRVRQRRAPENFPAEWTAVSVEKYVKTTSWSAIPIRPERKNICAGAKMANDLQRNAHVAVEIRLPNGGVFGPDELALIEAVRSAGSIIGASRALGPSYRKCWLDVDAMNRMFESAVIVTFPGRHRGGAEITAFGERLVALCNSIERHANTSSRASLQEIVKALDWSFAAKSNGEESDSKLNQV